MYTHTASQGMSTKQVIALAGASIVAAAGLGAGITSYVHQTPMPAPVVSTYTTAAKPSTSATTAAVTSPAAVVATTTAEVTVAPTTPTVTVERTVYAWTIGDYPTALRAFAQQWCIPQQIAPMECLAHANEVRDRERREASMSASRSASVKR